MSLKVDKLSKSYGKKNVLDNVSLNFQENKIYGLLGNNGAGKSTLLNIINNRIFATSGQISLDNQPVRDNERALNEIFLTSEDNFFPSKNKISTIFKMTEKFYGSFDWDLANRMVKDFDLDTNKRMGKLSTGYRSIAKLIISLSVPCKYIFLDEPVLGLDTNHRELFYDYLLETYEDNMRTFVISTHLIEEITNLLEEIIILDGGQVKASESVDSLLENTYVLSGSTAEVEALLKDVQVISREKLGGSETAYVKGVVEDSVGVSVGAMSLQDYFMKITSRKKEK
jgi:ABC-type multidrug transport system, ATPase component